MANEWGVHHKWLLHMVVSASGELPIIQECCGLCGWFESTHCLLRAWYEVLLCCGIFRWTQEVRRIFVFSGNGRKNILGDFGNNDFIPTRECISKRKKLAYHFRGCFEKGQFRLYYGVSHRGVAETKLVISALRMLALYMRFNGTGI